MLNFTSNYLAARGKAKVGLHSDMEFSGLVIAKFHYTDPTRTGHGQDPTRTKSAHIVGDELNSTTLTRHGPDRTRTDPHGLFLRRNSVGSVRIADKVRAGPVGSV